MSLEPASAREREPIIDALRGFAILGILLINIEVMRGSGWLLLIGGGSAAPTALEDRLLGFAIGWLGTGKSLASLAILFGIGAALMADQGARRRRVSTRLARAALCVAHGLRHRPYGALSGRHPFSVWPDRSYAASVREAAGARGACLVDPSLRVHTRSIVKLFASARGGTSAPGSTTPPGESADSAAAAFGSGSWSDIFAAQLTHAQLLQGGQLPIFPWVLSRSSLFGFAVARAGVVADLEAHRRLLARGAAVGLGIGLPLNFGLGFDGPLSGWGMPPGEPGSGSPSGETSRSSFGPPLLAVGYLCALTLFFLRRGAIRPLVAVGRMALTAYVLQSALALAAFGGLGLYDRLTTTSAMSVVAAIWAFILVFCPVWLRHFRLGPVEAGCGALAHATADCSRYESQAREAD